MQIIQKIILATFMLLGVCISNTYAGTDGLDYVETANGQRSGNIRQLIQWTHARLLFNKDLDRVAVGQNEVVDVEILNGREVLALAKKVGRTSIIVWYSDQSTETFLFSVTEDHSMLQRALREIHPNISLELAPDRQALVLRGTVPTVKFRFAAEAAARGYFGAGDAKSPAGDAVLVQNSASGAGKFRLAGGAPAGESSAAIINLIQVETLPSTTKQRIEEAIQQIGGQDVTVRRIVHGDIEDDETDTLLLEGSVHDQVALTRVLNVAARLYLGADTSGGSANLIRVVADESGGLLGERGFGQSNAASLGSNIPGLGGGGANQLSNEVKSNIGRAKLLSIADGRILSVIDVRDLPQVRVSVQIHEVDRQRMKNWRPDLSLVSSDYNAIGSSADGLGVRPQAPRADNRETRTQIEGALQILGGTLSNHLQIGGGDLAFDLLFSLMEREGISRTLSRPTLTVLAGEDAVFQVGGEVPVPNAFAPTGVGINEDGVAGNGAPGVFSGTDFKPFGVQLKIRPMVGEDDRITLDVQPTVSLPDVGLTSLIADSTGASLNTTAFNTRSLQTTTRLRDGQPLVIGGLVSRNLSDNKTYTPGVHDLPGVGWLAKTSDRSDADRELIIIVTPVIVREPMENVALWQFPTPYELLADSVGMKNPGRRVPPKRETETESADKEPLK